MLRVHLGQPFIDLTRNLSHIQEDLRTCHTCGLFLVSSLSLTSQNEKLLQKLVGHRQKIQRLRTCRPDMAEGNQGALDVDGYTVKTAEVLGRGAFGIVFLASGSQREDVAVKRLDIRDAEIREKTSQDLTKLKSLNHRNIVKIFNVHKEDDVLWVFMQFCELGDLNKFFLAKNPRRNTVLDIYLDISEGMVFLPHKNVIHRDLKPANVVMSGEPPVVKLTDFDVSRFLEEPYNTSLMSSNVGTPAFKAHEFFVRSPHLGLTYRRSVDIYSMGLTFLAMMQGHVPLRPQIETLTGSHVHGNIGKLVADWMRWKQEALDVISTSNIAGGQILETTSVTESQIEDHIRRLISMMTRARGEDRLLASEVLQGLRDIKQVRFNVSLCVGRHQCRGSTSCSVSDLQSNIKSMAFCPASQVFMHHGEIA